MASLSILYVNDRKPCTDNFRFRSANYWVPVIHIPEVGIIATTAFVTTKIVINYFEVENSQKQ